MLDSDCYLTIGLWQAWRDFRLFEILEELGEFGDPEMDHLQR